MASSKAATVAQYLASLPDDRRRSIAAVRKVINKNLPSGFEEGMLFGMIGYYVPLTRYSRTYNKQPLCIAGLASQKGHMSVYLIGVYGDPATNRWFQAEYKKSGKKLDMGKSCVRFKSADDLPLDLVGKVIAKVSMDELIAWHDATHSPKKKAKRG